MLVDKPGDVTNLPPCRCSCWGFFVLFHQLCAGLDRNLSVATWCIEIFNINVADLLNDGQMVLIDIQHNRTDTEAVIVIGAA